MKIRVAEILVAVPCVFLHKLELTLWGNYLSNTMSKKCIVTGAAGFIGSHLSEALVDAGHTVFGVDNLSTGRIENIAHLNPSRFFFVNSDILLTQTLEMEIDWVFHLAARADVVPSIEEPMLYHDVNVTGTILTLELARKLKAKKFVYAASSSCYGDQPPLPTRESARVNPKYPYALTKYLGEEYVRHWGKVYGLPTTSLRLFNVYGPRSRTSGAYGAVMGVFLSQIANKKPLTIVGSGEQKRDFTHVKDVVNAFLRAAHSNETGIFNVGTGEAQSINYLANLFGRYEGVPNDIVYIPDRPGEPRITLSDTSLIKEKLSWKAMIPFHEGAKAMRKQVDQFKDAPLWDKESIAQATKAWFDYMA